ncbi:MAG: dihydropteroate synthase [Akkermansia sp.]
MGILNVTPDSFSDGGRYASCSQAVEHALEMQRAGAMIIDVGGESTRPGSQSVPFFNELQRVLPVIREIRKCSDVIISVDTRKPAVAHAALEAGADIINDVEGMRAKGMAAVCASAGCGVVVMHMQGQPETMQERPHYDDVVGAVRAFFEERYEFLLGKGLKPEQICWDPGIGFGKSLEHNLSLLAHLEDLRVGGRPILLALSRKRMISEILGSQAEGRLPLGTAVLSVLGHQKGAQLHRVHDVKECRHALELAMAVERGDE